MNDEKDKLEFFSDLKTQLLLVLGGIVSLTTVIPAFLNSTTETFGWDSICWGYYFFVFIYFIVPYLFYLIYCSIHDDVGYLELLREPTLSRLKERKSLKVFLEIIVPLVGFLYLIFPFRTLSTIFTVVLIYVGFSHCFDAGKRYRSQKALFREFYIITGTIFLVFLLFFKNAEHQLPSYSIEDQQKAFKAYELKGRLKKDFVDQLDSAKKLAYEYRLQAAVRQPDLENVIIKNDGCPGCGIAELNAVVSRIADATPFDVSILYQNKTKLNTAISNMLKHDSDQLIGLKGNLVHVEEIYRSCSYLYDYSLTIQRDKLVPVSSQWARLLKDLQLKSMVWFLFLILLGLSLWFKMQFELKSIKNPTYYKVPLLKDNIGQVKSLVLLLLVLVVPWFRQIDSKDIDLERPFLGISLSGLANGEYTSGPSIIRRDPLPSDSLKQRPNPHIDTGGHKNDTSKRPVLPNVEKYYDSAKYHDPILDTINKNVLNTQYLIQEHAKRTILNPIDRNIQFKPKDKKP